MYIQREEDGNVAMLMTPKEAWILSSLAIWGQQLTQDDEEITLMLALADLFLLLGDEEILDLAMEAEYTHGHSEEELVEIREGYRKGILNERKGRKLLD